MGDFEWKAALGKLKNKGWTDANALTNMKKQWKVVFETKSNEIFDAIWVNQNLRNSLFTGFDRTQSKAIYNKYVQDMDDKLFKFIKVE